MQNYSTTQAARHRVLGRITRHHPMPARQFAYQLERRKGVVQLHQLGGEIYLAYRSHLKPIKRQYKARLQKSVCSLGRHSVAWRHTEHCELRDGKVTPDTMGSSSQQHPSAVAWPGCPTPMFLFGKCIGVGKPGLSYQMLPTLSLRILCEH